MFLKAGDGGQTGHRHTAESALLRIFTLENKRDFVSWTVLLRNEVVVSG